MDQNPLPLHALAPPEGRNRSCGRGQLQRPACTARKKPLSFSVRRCAARPSAQTHPWPDRSQWAYESRPDTPDLRQGGTASATCPSVRGAWLPRAPAPRRSPAQGRARLHTPVAQNKRTPTPAQRTRPARTSPLFFFPVVPNGLAQFRCRQWVWRQRVKNPQDPSGAHTPRGRRWGVWQAPRLPVAQTWTRCGPTAARARALRPTPFAVGAADPSPPSGLGRRPAGPPWTQRHWLVLADAAARVGTGCPCWGVPTRLVTRREGRGGTPHPAGGGRGDAPDARPPARPPASAPARTLRRRACPLLMRDVYSNDSRGARLRGRTRPTP